MSSRQDIRDGADFDHSSSGLIYTDVLGWIDMGHARGYDVEELQRQFMQGEGSGRDYYGAVGSFKNPGFKPIIFPDPDDPCVKHEPYIAELPMFMKWLYPWDDFTSGIVNVLTENGTAFGYTGIR